MKGEPELNWLLETGTSNDVVVEDVVHVFVDVVFASNLNEDETWRAANMLARSQFYKKNSITTRAFIRSCLMERKYGSDHNSRKLEFWGQVLVLDARITRTRSELTPGFCTEAANVLKEYAFSDPVIESIYLELLYYICALYKVPDSELDALDIELVEYLFQCIRDDRPVAHRALYALLALSDQYVGYQNRISEGSPFEDPSQTQSVNKVFEALRSRGRELRDVGSRLVMNFNRSESKMSQVLLTKLLYTMFSTKETADFFYINDLKVLLDVMLRELLNLSHGEEELLHHYLKVLQVLLANTSLSEDRYKRQQIISVLKSFLSWDNELTLNLVRNCLRVDWIEPQAYKAAGDSKSPEIIETNTLDSGPIESPFADTVMRACVRKPPPPLPRKGLCTQSVRSPSSLKPPAPPPPPPRGVPPETLCIDG